MNIPENAVQEFQIATNRVSAELGRSGSSVTNVITKQGTNALHGGVGVYVRDKALQGLPAPHDPSIGITPPFHRYQTAGDAGGPFKQDKAWRFVAVEDRQQLGADLVGERNTSSHTIDPLFATAPGIVDSAYLEFGLNTVRREQRDLIEIPCDIPLHAGIKLPY